MPENLNDVLDKTIAKMETEIASAKGEAAKLRSGNKAAVSRFRGHMQTCKEHAQSARETTLQIRDAM